MFKKAEDLRIQLKEREEKRKEEEINKSAEIISKAIDKMFEENIKSVVVELEYGKVPMKVLQELQDAGWKTDINTYDSNLRISLRS